MFKYDYLEEIKQSPEYLRLSKDYENLDEIIYLAEDKVDDIRDMKKMIGYAKTQFKTEPDYGLLKFYLLMKYKKETTMFLFKYGEKTLRDLAKRVSKADLS